MALCIGVKPYAKHSQARTYESDARCINAELASWCVQDHLRLLTGEQVIRVTPRMPIGTVTGQVSMDRLPPADPHLAEAKVRAVCPSLLRALTSISGRRSSASTTPWRMGFNTRHEQSGLLRTLAAAETTVPSARGLPYVSSSQAPVDPRRCQCRVSYAAPSHIVY
jgi:hypothetical protein